MKNKDSDSKNLTLLKGLDIKPLSLEGYSTKIINIRGGCRPRQKVKQALPIY
jgi:hypothetical protein